MSCFVVPDFHIDALVSWAADNGAPAFFEGLTPITLAAELYCANCAAYRERYGETVKSNYMLTRRDVRGLTPEQIIKACNCLDYQCADWSDWAGSVGDRALTRIRDHAITRLPGYQAAAWQLDEGVTSCA